MSQDDKHDYVTPSESDQINALRHEYRFNGAPGWLSTLVWNVRNTYLTWPDGKTENRAVQLLVEGFLAEVDDLRRQLHDADRPRSEA